LKPYIKKEYKRNKRRVLLNRPYNNLACACGTCVFIEIIIDKTSCGLMLCLGWFDFPRLEP
jgi:hypothetical protein